MSATKTKRPDFSRKILTINHGKRFIEALNAADLMFHFEDDPADVGNRVDGQWVRTFSDEEAKHLNKRLTELYNLNWKAVGHECPIGYALEVMRKSGALDND